VTTRVREEPSSPLEPAAILAWEKRLAILEIALLTARAIHELDLEIVPGEKDGTCAFTNQILEGIADHPPPFGFESSFSYLETG